MYSKTQDGTERNGTGHLCPYCGVPLHEKAVFCPYCARSINRRTELRPPALIWRKVLRRGTTLLVIAGIILGMYLASRPRVYDAQGEVIYTDRDGTYQLVLGDSNNRYEPIDTVAVHGELDQEYRIPSRLYVNHVDSGADAGQIFLQKVERVVAELIQPSDSPSPVVCTQPAPHDAIPGAALVSFQDFTGRSGTAELLWTIEMKNGDTIRLRQTLTVEPIHTYDYYPEEGPMGTLEELQALVDQIAETIEPDAVVNIHLPAVTYEGRLVMEGRPVNLYGSKGDVGNRTVFTDTIRAASTDSQITYIKDIDFIGDGGVGISASARLWVENCRFTGWKTAVLGYGYTWVNTIECCFENNQTGFHFNSTGSSVSHTMFNGNQFRDNGTAVLLEHVPTDVTLNFADSVFSGNGTDIDNRCNQSLDISEAVFE